MGQGCDTTRTGLEAQVGGNFKKDSQGICLWRIPFPIPYVNTHSYEKTELTKANERPQEVRAEYHSSYQKMTIPTVGMQTKIYG